MTENLEDTWHSRDFLVLREAARELETVAFGQGVRVEALTAATGLDPDSVIRALRALEDADLLQVTWRMPAAGSRAVRVSAEGKRLVGQWPTADSALERILAALEAIAENTDEDDDTRSKADKFRTWLKTGATTVGLGVAQAAITGQLPGQ